jgi:hypothetical protein
MAPIGATVARPFASHNLVVLLGGGVLSAERGLHILQGKGHLLSADALGLAAEVGATQHRDDVIEPLVLLGEAFHLGSQNRLLMLEPVAIGCKPGVVRAGRENESLQRVHIIGKVVE